MNYTKYGSGETLFEYAYEYWQTLVGSFQDKVCSRDGSILFAIHRNFQNLFFNQCISQETFLRQ